MASSLKFKQRKWLLNTFITSQFSYAPVIWMFHSRKLNNRIKRALRLVYKNYNSSFDELPVKDNSLRIHQSNRQKLAIEILQVKLGLPPEIMKNIFFNNQESIWLKKRNQVKKCPHCSIWYLNCFFCCTKNLVQHPKKLQRM